MYEHGRGVKQDYQEAFRLYCMAADFGDQEAYYDLGWMYFNNRGVAQDPAIAAGWFRRAAQSGDPLAKRMLTVLADVEPKPDNNCTPLDKNATPTRQQIESWVRRWAPEYGLEPELVLAVIAAESNFDPQAHSHMDARGLMQLIPATARRFGVANSFDPAQNIGGGAAYLGWLLDRFGEDILLALAGYNAGEGAVDKHGGVPPYRETRDYVVKVLDAVAAAEGLCALAPTGPRAPCAFAVASQ
ncbi:MAG: transglycosylase SLT domain-containing protein [Sedimenticola sp.]|nr:transglycosylase SLT domain-containing protein [Sedimenticola sp.]